MLNFKTINELYPFVWAPLDAQAKRIELAKLICMHYLDTWLELSNELFEVTNLVVKKSESAVSRELILRKKSGKLYNEARATFCPPFNEKAFFGSNSVCDLAWKSLYFYETNSSEFDMKFVPNLLKRMARSWNYEYLIAS